MTAGDASELFRHRCRPLAFAGSLFGFESLAEYLGVGRNLQLLEDPRLRSLRPGQRQKFGREWDVREEFDHTGFSHSRQIAQFANEGRDGYGGCLPSARRAGSGTWNFDPLPRPSMCTGEPFGPRSCWSSSARRAKLLLNVASGRNGLNVNRDCLRLAQDCEHPACHALHQAVGSEVVGCRALAWCDRS